MHKSVKITCYSRKKPDVITLYDCKKGGVDVMHMISSSLSTRIQSRRWPLNALAFVLDTARSNAQTILKDNNNDGNRNSFQYAWEIGVVYQTTYSQPIQESCWSAGSCFETNPKSTGDRRAIGPAKNHLKSRQIDKDVTCACKRSVVHQITRKKRTNLGNQNGYAKNVRG